MENKTNIPNHQPDLKSFEIWLIAGIVTSYANPFVNIHLLNKAFLIMGMVTPIHSYPFTIIPIVPLKTGAWITRSGANFSFICGASSCCSSSSLNFFSCRKALETGCFSMLINGLIIPSGWLTYNWHGTGHNWSSQRCLEMGQQKTWYNP